MNSTRLIRLDKVNTILKIFTFLYFSIMFIVCIILASSPVFCLWILTMLVLFSALIQLKELRGQEFEAINNRCNKHYERIDFINDLYKTNIAINALTNK